jgi:hypothetical protein
MKRIYFVSTIVILILILGACTSEFEEFNTHPHQITDEDLKQDYNHIGAFIAPLLRSSHIATKTDRHQLQHNLTHEAWISHLAPPTPFANNRNNTTYYITWNNRFTYWEHVYAEVMAPARLLQQRAEDDGYEVFARFAKMLQLVSASRLTSMYGPIIYSEYGSTSQTILYDSEPDLYEQFFTDLDTIVGTFYENISYKGMAKFDETYMGDMSKWVRFVNSWRLMLAIRISKVAPQLAKTQGEKAINHPGGLLINNNQNMSVPLLGIVHPISTISRSWNDTRMGAAMESILVGYEDNRISKFFEPATDNTLYPDHPGFPYKGIRNGAELVNKNLRTSYSTVNISFSTATTAIMLPASLVHFMLAEAALRGWSGSESAQLHYENGIKSSFAQWGASGVDDYIINNTRIPIDYNDPVAEGSVNDFENQIQVTVKWDETASNEVKLEKIITQKWIASFQTTVETWVDFRRTGYPKLPPVYINQSDATWGRIEDGDFIKRIPFVNVERNNNTEGVADATSKLGGPDLISTRLWWDTGGPNF